MTNQRSTNRHKPDARNGSLDAVSLFGAGSRNPSGPAVAKPRKQAGHMTALVRFVRDSKKNSCIKGAVHTCERSVAIHAFPCRRTAVVPQTRPIDPHRKCTPSPPALRSTRPELAPPGSSRKSQPCCPPSTTGRRQPANRIRTLSTAILRPIREFCEFANFRKRTFLSLGDG